MMEEPTTSLANSQEFANIDLRIEELYLDGFSPHDRFRIGRAIELELSRLIAENGIPKAWSLGQSLKNLDGGSFQVAKFTSPESIGTHVAQAVYRGSGT